MNWFNGPFDPQDTLFGIKVYWLMRAAGVLQLVSGAFAATDLMSRSRKKSVYEWMATRKNKPEKTKPPLWKSAMKLVLKVLVVVLIMSFVFSYCWMFIASNQPTGFVGVRDTLGHSVRLWPYVFVLLLVISLMIAGILAALANGLLVMYRDSVRGFRYLMPKIAPLFVPERFDNTVLWISIFLFVFASIAQIILS